MSQKIEVIKSGAPGENRTPTSKGNGILNPARLPVPPQGPCEEEVHNTHLLCPVNRPNRLPSSPLLSG